MPDTRQTRDQIYAKIAQALAPLPERTPYPEWETGLTHPLGYVATGDLWAAFCERLRAVNGTPIEGWTALAQFLATEGQTHGYCDPAMADAFAPAAHQHALTIETEFDTKRIDDYAFGITRAAGAIAQSGTLILKDTVTSARLGALAPWTHAAVLHLQDIYTDFAAALETMGDDPSIIWATGPSKTADVEGILIEGVHGPGIQIACLV